MVWEQGKGKLVFVLKLGTFFSKCIKVIYFKHQNLEVAWERDKVKRTPLGFKTWRVLSVNASVSPYYKNELKSIERFRVSQVDKYGCNSNRTQPLMEYEQNPPSSTKAQNLLKDKET